MATCILAIRRLQQTRFHSLRSFASLSFLHPPIPDPSSAQRICCFSQAFLRTLLTHPHKISIGQQFSTFQPSSARLLYNPIDFSDLEAKDNGSNEVGAIELVELVRKAKACASKKEAIDFLGSSGVKIDANKVCSGIWALRDDWELALLAFEWAEKWGCLNEKVLGLIVWVLGTHQKFDVAWSLIRDLHQQVDTRQAMLAIIERYAAANYHEKAIKTFHFLEKITASPDHSAFYTVMSALCRYGNVEEAEEFMLKNKKLFPLETEGFNIVLNGWCNISVDVYEAKRVWREMAGYCITPDATSYTHMISCFSRNGNLFDSLRLYDEMKKRGWVPSLGVYNSLIYVMACENCLSEALKILDKIKEMGLLPDSESYNCLISPLCEAGKFEEARSLLATMTQEGRRPTLETYHAFLKGINWESTLEILTQMKKDKVGPDSSTFLLIFDRFFKLKQPENALRVWVEMRNYDVHTESAHYASLIRGLIDCGCLAKAKELHTEMVSSRFVDDPKLKKLLQGPERGTHCRSVGPVNVAGGIDRLRPPSTLTTFRSRPRRGKKKQGGKSRTKDKTVGRSTAYQRNTF